MTALLQGLLCCLPEESDVPVCKKRGVSLEFPQALPNAMGEYTWRREELVTT